MTLPVSPAMEAALAAPPGAEVSAPSPVLPAASEESVPASPEEGEPAAAVPAPAAVPADYVPKTEFDALKKQADELAAWRAEQQQKQQEASQQQVSERSAAFRQQLKEEVGGYYRADGQPLSEDDRNLLMSGMEALVQLRSPEFHQSMAAHVQKFNEFERTAHAFELLKTFPPNTTLATLLTHFQAIEQFPDAERRKWAAEELRRQQYETNRQKQTSSGAERTEGGAGAQVTGDAMTRYREALQRGAPLPDSAEIDRLTARYLR